MASQQVGPSSHSSAQKLSRLEALPTELICLVVNELDAEEDKAALASTLR